MKMCSVVAACAAGAIGSAAADAALVQITYSGPITSVNMSRQLPIVLQFAGLTDFEYSVIVDTAVAANPSADPTRGEYANGIVSMTLRLGSASRTVGPSAFGLLEVATDNGDGRASLGLSSNGNAPGFFGFDEPDATIGDQAVALAVLPPGTFASVAIPTNLDLPVQPLFEDFSFQYIYGTGASILGDVTRVTATVVPVPGTAALLGIAGVVATRRRR